MITEITTYSDACLDAINRLLPQLSSSGRQMTNDQLQSMIANNDTHLFVAEANGTMLGMLSLCTYATPTGRNGGWRMWWSTSRRVANTSGGHWWSTPSTMPERMAVAPSCSPHAPSVWPPTNSTSRWACNESPPTFTKRNEWLPQLVIHHTPNLNLL